jgi:transposase
MRSIRGGWPRWDPEWTGGRPRLISDADIEVIVTTATMRPEKLGLPFTHWSLRKLAVHLASRGTRVGRERLRQLLHERGISFQRTRTWKESADPDKEAKLDRIEEVTSKFPDRCFAFDQFSPLSMRPCHDPRGRRGRNPAGCLRPITACTASASSAAAIPSAMISCGASSAAARAVITPWPC